MTEHWPGREQLIEAEHAVHDIAADKTEGALEVERAENLASNNGAAEAGRIAIDRFDHQIGNRLAMVVPALTIGKFRRHMLAEEARHVRALGCERRVQR